MKILYYNWIQFDKKNNSGGGVNVYQKNLIEEISKDKNNEVYFLSSGIYYNFFIKKTYIKETKNIYGNRCRTFKLINSTVPAPAKTMAKDIKNYLEDQKDYEILKNFIDKYGKFDVIHFNNIEGLTLNCLKLKKEYPNTKFIFSIHNYFLFCPQINLFYNETKNCTDYCNGKKCTECIKNFPTKRESIMYYMIDNKLETIHLEKQSDKIKLLFKKIKEKFKVARNNNNIIEQDDMEIFAQYRKENIKAINENFDVVLAVSDRVREIAIKMGINKDKIVTNYIGTKFASRAMNHKNHKTDKNSINIAYLGYFDKMKGFDFLIDSLEQLPKKYGKKINFYCYAKIKNDKDIEKVERINLLKENLLNVYYYNGYTHSELDKILSNIDLGIIPVVWEDNLPQIAIEFIANGVPVLTSNLGGTHELFNDDDFIFEAGNSENFISKLTQILDNKNKLEDFFTKTNKLTSMEEHIDKILTYYKWRV